MNTIRKFFANFQKHGTFSILDEKRNRAGNTETNLDNKGKGTLKTKADDDDNTNKIKIGKNRLEHMVLGLTENLKPLDKGIEVPDAQETAKNIDAEKPATDILKQVEVDSLNQLDEAVEMSYSHGSITNIDVENIVRDIFRNKDKNTTKNLEEVIEIPDLHETPKGSNNENPATDNTTECLKEFEEILEGLSKDITQACASLEDIEDVIKNINDDPQESLPETPRFDLEDLVQSFGSVDANLEAIETINLDEHNPNDSTQAEVIDLYDTDDEEAEVISISSEDSQTHVCVVGENTRWNLAAKDVNDKNDEPDNADGENNGTNYVLKLNDENIRPTDAPIVVDQNEKLNKHEEIEEVIAKKEILNGETELNDIDKEEAQKHEKVELKSDRSIDSDDCGYHSSDFEFITEDEAKMDGLIVNFNLNTVERNVSKRKRVKTIEIAVDQFSLRQNVSTPKQIGFQPNNIQLAQNVHDSIELNSFRPKQSDLRNSFDTIGQKHVDKHNHPPTQDADSEATKKSSLRNIRIRKKNTQDTITKDSETKTNENNGIQIKSIHNEIVEITYSGPSNIKRNELDMYNFGCVPLQDCPLNTYEPSSDKTETHAIDLSTHDPGTSNQRKNPINNTCATGRLANSDNNFNPGSSNVQDNLGYGPSNAQENNSGYGPSNLENTVNPQGSRIYPEMPDPSYERWRALRHKHSNRFVLDRSYRESHRTLNGDDYHRLFDPNFGPSPNQYMKQIENKSTMLMSMMLVEYDGIGFDMQMLKDLSDSDDDDEVKEEANESARKILDMYPVENRKRRRRF